MNGAIRDVILAVMFVGVIVTIVVFLLTTTNEDPWNKACVDRGGKPGHYICLGPDGRILDVR